jgi:hypothetical protein
MDGGKEIINRSEQVYFLPPMAISKNKNLRGRIWFSVLQAWQTDLT